MDEGTWKSIRATAQFLPVAMLVVIFVIAVAWHQHGKMMAARDETPSRFEPHERGAIYASAYDGPVHYVILLDNNTGVRYLYIWGGAASGGPAITRLWEKEDENDG